MMGGEMAARLLFLKNVYNAQPDFSKNFQVHNVCYIPNILWYLKKQKTLKQLLVAMAEMM